MPREKLKVWIVNAQENPPQDRSVPGRRQWRSNTLCERLADRGHEVIRWRSSFSHRKKVQLVEKSEKQTTDNYQHQYILSPEYKSHLGFKRILNHKELGREFSRLANSYVHKPDIIHICNVPLELTTACMKFARKNDIATILDVRDLWPDSYLNFLPGRLSFLKRPFLYLIQHVLKSTQHHYQQATAVTAISDKILKWGYKKARNRDKELDAVFPMANSPGIYVANALAQKEMRQKIGVSEESVIISYSGNVGFQTNFEMLNEAATILSKEKSNIHFVIAGTGPKYEQLKKASSNIANIHYLGWMEGPELRTLLSISDFGVIAFHNVGDYMMSMPNKFVEYLSANLPILCGTSGQMKELVDDWKCGWNFSVDAGGEALATFLINQFSDEIGVKILRDNAKKLHSAMFDLDTVLDQMANHLERVAQLRKSNVK
ncbi:MAG: glycosyltransferase family 4 protein [Rhodothermales bacterium]